MRRAHFGLALGALFAATSAMAQTRPAASQAGATARSDVPQVAPGVYLIAEPVGNLLVLVGSDGPVVIGPAAPTLVARARALLKSLGIERPAYAVVIAGDSAVERADGGWGGNGTITIAHEGLRNRVRRLARKDTTLRERMPMLGYSEVFQLAADGDEIHFVHHPPGFSEADVIAHFEGRQFLYMGNLFTTDGYPSINSDLGGSITGLIVTAKEFIDSYKGYESLIEPIVPGRGPTATMKDLQAYHDMLVAVRDRVQPMVGAGKTLDDVIAARPTAEFDARWGKGPVSPRQFVTMVYRAMKPAPAPK